MKILTIILLGLVFSLLLMGGISSEPETTVTCNSCEDCNSKLLAGRTLLLTEDIMTNISCIDIDGIDNVTFDGQGHEIFVNATSASIRNFYARYQKNLTIKNCVIKGGGDSIFIRNSENNLIENVTMIDNAHYSIRLNSVNSTVIRNSNFDNTNAVTHITVTGENNLIENNSFGDTSAGTAYGINLGTSAYFNNVTKNIFNVSSGQYNLLISGFNNSVWENNFYGNNDLDILLSAAKYNELWKNNFYGNGTLETFYEGDNIWCKNSIGNYYHWNIPDENRESGVCGILASAWPLPKTDSFDGNTTDFNSVDSANVTGLVLENDYGKIVWHETLNVEHADFDAYVNISDKFASVNLNILPMLNTSADISLYNLPWESVKILIDTGSGWTDCPENVCTILSYENGNLTFNTTYMANFAAARLTNNPPQIKDYSPLEAEINIDENASIEFNITAEDSDNDTLSYSWQLNGIEKSTEQNWTFSPGFDESGEYNVTVIVSDSQETISHFWNLTVNNVNRAPQITSSPVATAQENQSYIYSVIADDPDSDSISFSLITSPSGMSINSTGAITWIPDSAQIGNNQVVILANDSSLNDTQEFVINVDYINDAPVLNNIPDHGVNKNAELKFEITASDADLIYGDSLTYSANSTLAVTKINDTLAEASWTPSSSGVFYFDLTVEDSKHAKNTKTVKITVNEPYINQAPVLNHIGDKTAQANTQLRFSITGFDPENNDLLYSANLSGITILKMNNNIAEVSWTPDESFIGDNYVEFKVSDGSLEDSEIIKITVSEQPPQNSAPVITEYFPSETDINAIKNSEIGFSVKASDPDGDSLSYSWQLDGQEKSTRQNWTYTPNEIGEYSITVTVSDSQLQDAHSWNLAVNSGNSAPILNHIDDMTVYEGEIIQINPVATDLDNDVLIYSYSGWMDSDAKYTDYNDQGTHTVTVTASDGELSESQNVTITVLNAYEFRTAIKDRNTKARLNGNVLMNGIQKSVSDTVNAIFDYIHSGTEYIIEYSSSGYQTDSYPIYLDDRLAGCTKGSDCYLTGEYTTDCRWDSENSGWLCSAVKGAWTAMFTYVPEENAIKRIDYMVK